MLGEGLPLPDEVSALVERAGELPRLVPVRRHLQDLAADYARGLDEGRPALVAAMVGPTGAGKSTLLNALAGVELAREGVDRPTSDRAVIYAPEDAALADLGAQGAEVVRYRPREGAPWTGQVFVDTPDVNSVVRAHRDLARRIVERADVAIVLLHKGAVIEAAVAEFLAPFARRRRLLFALNFADELGAEARAQLKGQIASVAVERLGVEREAVETFAVSALLAKRGSDPSGEWAAFLAALQALGARAAGEAIKRNNAAGALVELRHRVEPALEETEAMLTDAARAFHDGWSRAAGPLRRDFADRLELARPHLAREVRSAAASRWWGPAAWWMRLTALAAGGYGAAAVLARRNLPIGLAAAAATAAVDRLREQTQARAADRKVVEAGPAEAAEEARRALAAARTSVEVRGGDATAMGLPTGEALDESLQRLRAEAWAAVQGQAVAEVVAGWWRWARFLLLPLINLPLLVLGVHVAYRVVRAYLAGQYLEFAYFLNAGALALLLAVAGGLLASISLAGAARRVRVRGVARFEEALALVERRIEEQLQTALAPARAAARRLVELGGGGPESGEGRAVGGSRVASAEARGNELLH